MEDDGSDGLTAAQLHHVVKSCWFWHTRAAKAAYESANHRPEKCAPLQALSAVFHDRLETHIKSSTSSLVQSSTTRSTAAFSHGFLRALHSPSLYAPL